jgi:hypothetical protein
MHGQCMLRVGESAAVRLVMHACCCLGESQPTSMALLLHPEQKLDVLQVQLPCGVHQRWLC